MKKSIYIFFLLILFISCNEQENPFVDKNYNPKIKIQSKIKVDPVSNNVLYKIYDKHFDKDGNVSSIVYYNKNSEKSAESIFKYSESSQSELYLEYSPKGDTLNVLSKNYVLDASGNVIKIDTYDNGILETSSNIKYNSYGNVLEEVTINDGVIQEKKYEYIYNESGKLEAILQVNPTGTDYLQKDSLVYSKNKLDMITINKDGNISQVKEYIYDEVGNISAEITSTPDKIIIEKIIYNYIYY